MEYSVFCLQTKDPSRSDIDFAPLDVVSLKPDGIAQGSTSAGRWTPVYDEGMELRLDGNTAIFSLWSYLFGCWEYDWNAAGGKRVRL